MPVTSWITSSDERKEIILGTELWAIDKIELGQSWIPKDFRETTSLILAMIN
jgi:hypothetical protein